MRLSKRGITRAGDIKPDSTAFHPGDILSDLVDHRVAIVVFTVVINKDIMMNGLPPRGKGRWRQVLSDIKQRDNRSNHMRGTWKTSSASKQPNGNGTKRRAKMGKKALGGLWEW